MLAAGAAPNSVALAIPPTEDGLSSCFGNAEVENLVHTNLTSLGITLYQGYALIHAEGNEDGCIASAVFESDGQTHDIACDVLGCFANPNTDPETNTKS